MKRLSIIIPTYNSSKTIERCINSILTQTFTDYEILIMDGLSKDNTIDIIKKYNSDKITIITEQDNGVYDAMNKGIQKSKGEWLYFLGSDDYIFSEKTLENIFKNNSYNNYDVIYGDVECKTLDNNHKGEWSLDKLNYNRCHQAIFYKKIVFDKFGLYKLEYPIWADHEFNLNWILDNDTKKIYIKRTIAYYSNNGLSSINLDLNFGYNFIDILQTKKFSLLDKDLQIHYYKIGISMKNFYGDKEKTKLQNNILNSPTYKIGKFLLTPLRWIKIFVKEI